MARIADSYLRTATACVLGDWISLNWAVCESQMLTIRRLLRGVVRIVGEQVEARGRNFACPHWDYRLDKVLIDDQFSPLFGNSHFPL